MVIYIVSAIFCLIGLVLQIDGTVVPDSFHVLYILGGLSFLISIITQGVMYSDQCIAIERIAENIANKKIYEEKERVLIGECKEYLKDVYPNIEKDIFNSMASAKAILLNFPEINSHKTITKLVDMINTNKNHIYGTDIEITALKRQINVRKRVAHFWIYSKMIPEYVPEEETK